MNQENLEKLKKLSLKDPIIKEAYDELISIYENPAKNYYLEISKTIEAISVEFKHVRNGNKENAPILGGDDKLFDRIFKCATDADKVFNSLAKGLELINPQKVKEEKAEDDTGVSFLDKKANKVRSDG